MPVTNHCKALVHSSNELYERTMMSTGKDNAFCFDHSAKRLIVFSDELAKTRMYKKRWKRELN